MPNSLKYTYPKSVGFYLAGNILKSSNSVVNPNQDSLVEFVSTIKNFEEELSQYIYYKEGFRKGLYIRKIWAKEFCYKEFSLSVIDQKNESESKNKIYKQVKDISLESPYVAEHIHNCFEMLNENSQKIQEYIEWRDFKGNERAKPRYSEIASYIKQITQKSVLISIIEFLNRAKNKKSSEDDIVANNLKQQAQKLQGLAQQLLSEYLVNTIQGKRLIKGSFNYFTVDKLSKSKEKYEEEKEELQKKLNAKCSGFKNDKGFDDRFLVNIRFTDKDDNLLTTIGNLTLKKAGDRLKDFRSVKKDLFVRWIQALVNQSYDSYDFSSIKLEKFEKVDLSEYDGLSGVHDLRLFKPNNNNYDAINQFFADTVELQKLSNQRSNDRDNDKSLQARIKSLALRRGAYYTNNCEEYTKFCDLYKSIKIKSGAIQGNIKNLEAEQLESQSVTHWALLATRNSKLQLVIVPKLDRVELQKTLNIYSVVPNSEQLRHYLVIREIKSLTARALVKQVEKNKGYFDDIKKLSDDLSDIEKNQKIEQIKIKYCNEFLKAGTLDIAHFGINLGEFCKANYANFEGYQKSLEKKCYKVVEYYIPSGDWKKFTKDCEVLDIDAFDIHDRPQQNRTNPENHTVIWDKFLDSFGKSKNIETRLNPEFTIFERDKIDDQKSQFITARYPNGLENRRNKHFYRAMFSISQNSLDKPTRTTKINTLEQIEEFNNKFKTTLDSWKNPQGYYTFYGLDRGQEEMATLCKVRLNSDLVYDCPAIFKDNTIPTYPDKVKFPLYEPKFEPFEFYRLKEKFGEGFKVLDNLELIQILKNPSQWMTDYESRIDIFNKYFELTASSCLNMTRAKLIKNKITNKNVIMELGDLMTYQKFAILNAKMKVAGLIMSGLDNLELIINTTKNAIAFKKVDKNGNIAYENIYFYDQKLNTESLTEIQSQLQSYISDYDKIQFEEKEKLFKIKKALAGNMVGILDYLYCKEKGFIVLENLTSANLNYQTKDSITNHRQLEQSLYQKWQGHCTVPPKVNMPSMWQELFELQSIQNESFIIKENTKFDPNKNDPEDEYIVKVKLGNILLVDKSNTSNACPKCGIPNYDYDGGFGQKWKQHRFGCVSNQIEKKSKGNCGFDTGSTKVTPNIESNFMGLDGLTTSDSVASYNIAKRGLELIIGDKSLKTEPAQTLKVENNKNTLQTTQTRGQNNYQPKTRK